MPKIRHAFVSTKTDSLDTTLVRPLNWNAPLVYTDDVGVPSATDATVRKVLTASVTYYVATTGNDSTGTGSLTSPWATPQHAVNTILSTIDFAGFRVTVQLAAGTYVTQTVPVNETIFVQGGQIVLLLNQQWVGGGELFIIGDETTPANVIFDCTGGDGVIAEAGNGGHFFVSGIQFTNVSINGSAFRTLAEGAQIFVGDVSLVGSGNGETFFYASDGGFILVYDRDIRISGTIAAIIRANSAKVHFEFNRLTLVSTPVFSDGSVSAFYRGNVIWYGNTVTGSATGAKFSSHSGGQITALDSGGNYLDLDALPGSTAADFHYGGEYNNVRLDFVTPYSFGAIGDGGTNDAVALQAWLDCGLPELYLPDATFATTAALTVPSTVRRILAPGTLLWTGANGVGNLLTLSGTYTNGLLVENLTLSKPWTGTPAGGAALYVSTSNITLRNVKIPHGGRWGMYFDTTNTGIVVENCVIADCYSSAVSSQGVGATKDIRVTGGSFSNAATASGDHCVTLSQGTSNANKYVVENALILPNGTASFGILAKNLGPGSSISNNRIVDCIFDGIEITGNSTDFTIANNVISSTRSVEVGIGLSPGTGEISKDGLIAGNHIESPGGSGILLWSGGGGSSEYISIIGNYVKDASSGTAGILMQAATHCNVKSNVIVDTASTMSYGVKEEGSSDFNKIENNTIEGSAIADYLVLGASTATGITPIVKTADEGRSSDSTITDDATLKFKVAANTTYWFEFHIFYSTPAAADFKYDVNGPAVPTRLRVLTRDFVPGAAAEAVTIETAFAFGPHVLLETSGTEGHIEIEGFLDNGANAGTVTFRWAQNSSNISATTVRQSSRVEYGVST